MQEVVQRVKEESDFEVAIISLQSAKTTTYSHHCSIVTMMTIDDTSQMVQKIKQL